VTLRAIHIAGVTNLLADDLSRGRTNPTEWCLAPHVAQTIFSRIYYPSIDLFATFVNKQLPVYCSRLHEPQAYAVDALSIDWTGMTAYAFPPISLLPLVVEKIVRDGCNVILIAPFWPKHLWFRPMVDALAGLPRRLPDLPDLLRMQGRSRACLPIEHLKLTAWPLSGNAAARTAFLKDLPRSSPRGRRESTNRVYSQRLGTYYRWCSERGVSPTRASIANVGDFLTERFDTGLEAATVRNYKSAILAIHRGFPDGSKINDDRSIKLLLDGMFNTRPPQRKEVPPWDLNMVLEYLKGPPFEPLGSATLKNLTLKTVMLVALASGRRCSELHAISASASAFSRTGANLFFRPDFVAKNESASFQHPSIFLPTIDSTSSIREDIFWCPVRAVRYYLDRTSGLRGKADQMFLTHASPNGPASKSTIARWIVSVILDAQAIESQFRPKAHSVRSIASSWAFHKGVSIQEICDQVSWKAQTTFSAVYYRNICNTNRKGSLARAILTKSQDPASAKSKK
jgi:hypothetical protein